jgi:hypothetical protein
MSPTISPTSDSISYLMRSRKHTVVSQNTGIETIMKDLQCCGIVHKTPHLCNLHYKRFHFDLPNTDPMTWPDVFVKDRDAHISARVQLPYTPFPKPSRGSTWTIRVSARTQGTREVRAIKREESKNSHTSLKQQNAASIRENQSLNRQIKLLTENHQQEVKDLRELQSEIEDFHSKRYMEKCAEITYLKTIGAKSKLGSMDMLEYEAQIQSLQGQIQHLEKENHGLNKKCDKMGRILIHH